MNDASRLLQDRLDNEWCYLNGMLCQPGSVSVKTTNALDTIVFTKAPNIEDVCDGNGRYSASPLMMLAVDDEPGEVERLRSVTFETDYQEITSWSVGDKVRINYSQDRCHGRTGKIAFFQVMRAVFKHEDDAGIVVAMVVIDNGEEIYPFRLKRLVPA